jgi:hypothetical protein
VLFFRDTFLQEYTQGYQAGAPQLKKRSSNLQLMRVRRNHRSWTRRGVKPRAPARTGIFESGEGVALEGIENGPGLGTAIGLPAHEHPWPDLSSMGVQPASDDIDDLCFDAVVAVGGQRAARPVRFDHSAADVPGAWGSVACMQLIRWRLIRCLPAASRSSNAIRDLLDGVAVKIDLELVHPFRMETGAGYGARDRVANIEPAPYRLRREKRRDP